MVDFNSLGQCIDSTFGRSSTTDDATKAIRIKLAGNGDSTIMTVVYTTVVNTFGFKDLEIVQEKCRKESESLVADAVAKIKKQYKELAGDTLKFDQIVDKDGMELVTGTFNSNRRMSYYRRHTIFVMK